MNNKKLYNNLMNRISKTIKNSLNEEWSEDSFTIGDQYHGSDAYDLDDLSIYDENTLFTIIYDLDQIATEEEADVGIYEFEEPIMVEYPQSHKSGRDFIEYKPIYIDSVYFDLEYMDLILYADDQEIGPYDKIEDEEVRKEILRKTIEAIANITILSVWNESGNYEVSRKTL